MTKGSGNKNAKNKFLVIERSAARFQPISPPGIKAITSIGWPLIWNSLSARTTVRSNRVLPIVAPPWKTVLPCRQYIWKKVNLLWYCEDFDLNIQ